MKKENIIKLLKLKKEEIINLDFFLSKVVIFNKHTNLIGKSTLENIWDRHILDCLQLSNYISDKKLKIIDLGTGAGLPGIPLSIVGFKNITMVDSVSKKVNFVKQVIKELSLSASIQNKRIENLKIPKQDVIISRALAPLDKLLTYALLHSNKNTTSLFLKGRSVNNEIEMAKKKFLFNFSVFKSASSGDGCILKIKNIIKKND